MADRDYIWYACYGSNLLEERFLIYITGGKLSINPLCDNYGCDDRRPPRDKRAVLIPYDLYFAKSSSKWEYKGVAFLDHTKPGLTLGRMYLITREQFEDVKLQEGGWYSRQLSLGNHTDGREIVTFTGNELYEANEPGALYLEVMRRGLLETYPVLKTVFPEIR